MSQKYLATGNNIMLKTLSIRTGLLSLLAVMTLLLLIVSGIGIYAPYTKFRFSPAHQSSSG
ncbi:hypothetical protein PGS1_00555 [Enterobacter cloacae subsp. cloacae GS1]|nr:hypothetical protein PGS1_00555 [Enterobacter cloacae subsp. cloacae GS1]